MSEDQPKIETLGAFVNRVSEIREEWGIDENKELWFPIVVRLAADP